MIGYPVCSTVGTVMALYDWLLYMSYSRPYHGDM
jgi:hypothetical protein